MRALVIAAVCGGCFSPTYQQNLVCAQSDPQCPPGQSCGLDNVCRSIKPQQSIDAPPVITIDGSSPGIDASGIDAGSDGSPQPLWSDESDATLTVLNAIWGTPGAVFAVGATANGGVIMSRGTGGVWQVAEQTSFTNEPRAIAGAGTGGTTVAWAGGSAGSLSQYSGGIGGSWALTGNVAAAISGMYLASATVGAAVGPGPNAYILSPGPVPWVASSPPGSAGLNAVWIDPANVVYAVGAALTVIMRNPSTGAWSDVLGGPTGTTENYRSIWGDGVTIYLGTDTRLLRLSAGAWSTVSGVPGCAGLDGASNTVWCVHANAIYRNGLVDFTVAGASFNAIRVVGTEVFAVGVNGAIWHRTSLD